MANAFNAFALCLHRAINDYIRTYRKSAKETRRFSVFRKLHNP